MWKAFLNIFKIPELRKKFLFTLGILVVFRIGAQIPVPGIDLARLLEMNQHGAQGGFADFLNLFTGGARENASVFSLGVMPYITATIIMQLLKAVVPSVDRMLKEGPEGRKKFQQYGRLGTVAVTLVQGFIYARGLINDNATGAFLAVGDSAFIVIFTLAVTAGTLILMWMGEQITERGIGNGISLIIMAGIVARLPHSIVRLFAGVEKGGTDPMNLVIVLALFAVIIGFVVFEEQGLRKIPVQYANRTAGGASQGGGQVTFLPFKVNPTGVIPIIFASSLLIIPIQLAQWFGEKFEIFKAISANMAFDKPLYMIVYFSLIIFFAYFYTEIELNPHDIAENLRKQGGFVPGVRPGQKTEEFLAYTLSRITLPGSFFLGIIALMPNIVIKIFNVPSNLGYLMGGTSLLIMVGVALDTLKQIESHLMMHHMDGFLTRSASKKGY
jgi:preprotein translocase subunit SecY